MFEAIGGFNSLQKSPPVFDVTVKIGNAGVKDVVEGILPEELAADHP